MFLNYQTYILLLMNLVDLNILYCKTFHQDIWMYYLIVLKIWLSMRANTVKMLVVHWGNILSYFVDLKYCKHDLTFGWCTKCFSISFLTLFRWGEGSLLHPPVVFFARIDIRHKKLTCFKCKKKQEDTGMRKYFKKKKITAPKKLSGQTFFG